RRHTRFSRDWSSDVCSSDLKFASADPYELEVSSPGLSRPLSLNRHWVRAKNRMVKFTLSDGTKLRGRLTEVTDTEVVISVHHERSEERRVGKEDRYGRTQ